MEFGLNFFPEVKPEEKSARDYWREALYLTSLCDALGYRHVRTVEHYFHHYGGYSPNPLIFLTAASQRTKNVRLVTGAILPVFNHPLKVAAEIGEFDAISDGRLDVGFARAFLPHEFRRMGRSLDESRARFNEGFEIVRRLLTEEHVTYRGEFHSFEDVTSLPRPTQRPHPPFWIAASSSDESFVNAGRLGVGLMTFPREAAVVRRWIELYREAWQKAGHPGRGRVMIAFQMFCAPTDREAETVAREEIVTYWRSIADANAEWTEGVTSKDYPNNPRMVAAMRALTYEKLVANGAVWVGAPNTVRDQITAFADAVGGFEIASLQVNPHCIPVEAAESSMRLFAAEVMPRLRG